MGNKEEIKLAVNDFRLLNEALVNVGTLGWVVNKLSLSMLCLLEESLANALVYNNQSNLGWLSGSLGRVCLFSRFVEQSVFLSNDFVELLKLVVNDLLTHGVTDTITVDEDVLWHLAIELFVAVKGALEVIREHGRRNNFLPFLWLGACLGIVLAHEWVISSTEANGGLLALVTDIDTNKHGLV